MKNRFFLCLVFLYPYFVQSQLITDSLINIKNNCDFKCITNNFPEAQCYFVGEFHESNNNENIHFELFRYLNNSKGIKVFASEFPRSSKRLFDKYLKSKNEVFLDSVLKHFNNEDRFKPFFKRLAEFFSKNDSLVYMPLDIESNIFLALQELSFIQKRNKINFNVKNALSENLDFGELKHNKAEKIVRSLYYSFQKDKIKYQSSFYDNDYKDYDRILNQLYISICNPKYNVEDLSVREQLLVSNVEELLLNNGLTSFYLSIGELHICLEPNVTWLRGSVKWVSLAARLKAKYKKINLVAGKIYYTNTSEKYEDYENAQFVNDYESREFIRKKTRSLSIYFPNGDKRFNFLIVNNVKNKKEIKLNDCD